MKPPSLDARPPAIVPQTEGARPAHSIALCLRRAASCVELLAMLSLGCQAMLDEYTFDDESGRSASGSTGSDTSAVNDMASLSPGAGGSADDGGSGTPGGAAGSTELAPSSIGGRDEGGGGTSRGGGGGAPITEAAGASGNPDAPPEPLPAARCATEPEPFRVIYEERTDMTSGIQASMVLEIQNVGAPVALSSSSIRYWFDGDGYIDFAAEVDYAAVLGSTVPVRVTFGRALGSDYAEARFSTDDELASSLSLQLRIHTSSYASLDQSNDFSFIAGADNIENRNISVYVDGMLVAGCEPGL